LGRERGAMFRIRQEEIRRMKSGNLTEIGQGEKGVSYHVERKGAETMGGRP